MELRDLRKTLNLFDYGTRQLYLLRDFYGGGHCPHRSFCIWGSRVIAGKRRRFLSHCTEELMNTDHLHDMVTALYAKGIVGFEYRTKALDILTEYWTDRIAIVWGIDDVQRILTDCEWSMDDDDKRYALTVFHEDYDASHDWNILESIVKKSIDEGGEEKRIATRRYHAMTQAHEAREKIRLLLDFMQFLNRMDFTGDSRLTDEFLVDEFLGIDRAQVERDKQAFWVEVERQEKA